MDKVDKDKLVLPCLRGALGDWIYYSTLMSARQIYEWVDPVKDIREAKGLHDILQRDLKKLRKDKISQYLLEVKSHFFNSIIVGVFNGTPDWAEISLSEKVASQFGSDIKKNLEASFGIMNFNGTEQMFAIDGQHRIEGIKEAYVKSLEDKNNLIDDQFSIIFVGHLDDDLGKKRTRKLFSDINKNAKSVAEGDQLKIDEENLNAIVTRRIYANYGHFKSGEVIALTETAKLDKDDFVHFTNLLGLNAVNKKLRKIFRKKRGTSEWDEENVLNFLSVVEGFYDFAINNMEEYEAYFIGRTLNLQTAREDNKYLLFRPIGLTLLAGLYAHFYKIDGGLEVLKENINKIGFVFPESPLNRVVWNNGKMAANTKNQTLALDLCLYMLDQKNSSELTQLLSRYREMVKNDEAELPEKIIN